MVYIFLSKNGSFLEIACVCSLEIGLLEEEIAQIQLTTLSTITFQNIKND